VQAFGKMDIWINNAGYSSAAGLMLETPPAQAIDMFLANNMGTLYGAQAALHFMSQRREGTLVNMYGNGSFLRPASPTGLYGATKAWLTSFTRSLAKELKGSGIKVLGFSPGMMLTDMLTSPRVVLSLLEQRLGN
jgi:short-subunit dehydrogenase